MIVDGKQRLNAVLKFLRNEIKAFNTYYFEFEDRIPSYAEFIISINNLSNRKDVLQWYLELNTGGTVHSSEEIEKVNKLIALENLVMIETIKSGK